MIIIVEIVQYKEGVKKYYKPVGFKTSIPILNRLKQPKYTYIFSSPYISPYFLLNTIYLAPDITKEQIIHFLNRFCLQNHDS